MTSISRVLLILGAILLSHACYSAYEHASLYAAAPSSAAPAQASSTSSTTLPLDISLETVVSVILICIGLVLGAEKLKPISWRVWAGQVERESGGAGPFQALEDRVGFMDIRVRQIGLIAGRNERSIYKHGESSARTTG
ncbi:MAG: hypothetical protein LQ343_002138 [Gyalolechia ehrenbergii]|nr:MAG: hypothetical protein LQ343_002138 [Gyalolechia ehrenbergii]